MADRICWTVPLCSQVEQELTLYGYFNAGERGLQGLRRDRYRHDIIGGRFFGAGEPDFYK